MLRYTYSENSRPIDLERYCDWSSSTDDTSLFYSRYWDSFGNLPNFIRNYEEAIYGRSSDKKQHCINNTRQNVAIVHFHIASSANDLINKIVKTPRVTYADILSNIGIVINTTPKIRNYFVLTTSLSIYNAH